MDKLRPKPTAIELIAAERQRQIEQEGWTAEHDRQWASGQLALAAACYAIPDNRRTEIILRLWPWMLIWWKPTPDDRERELIKAAALLVAEIERLRGEREAGA